MAVAGVVVVQSELFVKEQTLLARLTGVEALVDAAPLSLGGVERRGGYRAVGAGGLLEDRALAIGSIFVSLAALKLHVPISLPCAFFHFPWPTAPQTTREA